MHFVGGGGLKTQCIFCLIVQSTLWEALKDALNMISETDNRIIIHFYNAMCTTQISKTYQKNKFNFLMQEFKRSIIFKRYARCRNANLNKIIFDKNRLYAHWIILCKKVISYRTYQGKDKKVIEKLKETFEDMISENIYLSTNTCSMMQGIRVTQRAWSIGFLLLF